MKGLVFLMGLSFCCLFSSAQQNVPQRLKLLKPYRQLTNFLVLDPVQQAKPNNNYQLILSRGKHYAVGNGDGQVFTPEGGIWKRIDKTRLEGYHYGAYLFDCNGTLMKYGGYGFWKNHGMFVYFNEHLGDWLIQPCDRDLPFSGNLAYFNREENSLYSFGNYIYNQSTSEEKTFLDSLYRIDLLKMKWENLGKLNYDLADRYHLHHRLSTLSSDNGCFILPISTDSTALYFNFKTLKYFVFNSKSNTRLFHFFSELPLNLQVYSDSYGLKILNTDSLVNVDSIAWEMALSQPAETANLIEQTVTTVDFKYTLILAGIGFGFGLILILYVLKRRKQISKNEVIAPPKSHHNSLDLSIANTLIFDGAMYPIEPNDYKALQKFIFQDATTLDLNDWLGLENKQPENQKKQRAEWIKRMNAFFNQIGFKENAFNRERQETDKRMFVYKMNTKLKAQNDFSSSSSSK
jgi:hypothetical protein